MKTFRKFVVATDSFKGCLGSEEAGGAVRDALRGLFPGAAVELLPLSDGGEGFLVPFARRGGFEETVETVRGPLGDPVRARWLWDAAGRRAIVESAEACGLGLVPR
ncbi:MAG: glycerate kinase, partial [Fibrobacterales bacterium]|nr:glycerate kinase [Fibrobacterales bacterium]